MRTREVKNILCLLCLMLTSLPLAAQTTALRTNLLYWGTTTPNAAVEWKMSRRFTLSATVGYNAFNYSSYYNEDEVEVNPKLHHLLVMPEVKYWFCGAYVRHFVGLHTFYADYNVGGIKFMPKGLSDYRYDGWLTGVGLSYGYQWALGKRWGIEASVGAGYVYMRYDKYRSGVCAKRRGTYRRHVFCPTKADLSIIYFIR